MIERERALAHDAAGGSKTWGSVRQSKASKMAELQHLGDLMLSRIAVLEGEREDLSGPGGVAGSGSATWPDDVQQPAVTFWCDNQVVVYVSNSLTSKS